MGRSLLTLKKCYLNIKYYLLYCFAVFCQQCRFSPLSLYWPELWYSLSTENFSCGFIADSLHNPMQAFPLIKARGSNIEAVITPFFCSCRLSLLTYLIFISPDLQWKWSSWITVSNCTCGQIGRETLLAVVKLCHGNSSGQFNHYLNILGISCANNSSPLIYKWIHK